MQNNTIPKFKIPPEESRVIAALRLPLAILVILIHTPYAPISSKIVSGNFCSIAVPMFFAISGYCLFSSFKEYNFEIYRNKLSSRIFSLLIPYIFWNLLAMFWRFGIQIFMLNILHQTPKAKLVSDYNIWDLFDILGFWPIGASPCDTPLWFLRDLMMLIIISPLLSFLINRVQGYLLFPLLISGILLSPMLPITWGSSFFACCFVLGGIIARESPAFMQKIHTPSTNTTKIIVLIYALASVTALFYQKILPLAVLYGLAAWCVIGKYLAEKFPFLCSSRIAAFSFFLYCFHHFLNYSRTIFSAGIGQIIKFTPPESLSSLILELSYWLHAFWVIGISYICFCIMERCGKTVSMLCIGKRK